MEDQVPQTPRKRFEQSVKKFFELEDMREEWDMFATRSTLDTILSGKSKTAAFRDRMLTKARKGRVVTVECWYKRFDEWDKHLDGYLGIDSGGVAPTNKAQPSHGTKRVDKLFSYLGTLDTKLSMAIGINSLILAGSTFLVKETDDLIAFAAFPDHGAGWVTAKIFQGILYVLLALTMTCCLFNIWHGLRAFRRIVWGDLQLYPGNAVEGERRQTDFFIISLTRRTNLFRVITYVTTIACQLTFSYAATAGIIVLLKIVFWIGRLRLCTWLCCKVWVAA